MQQTITAIKIYVNSKPLFISFTDDDSVVSLRLIGLSSEHLTVAQKHLEVRESVAAHIIAEAGQDIFTELEKHFQIFIAAGGVVRNSGGAILLIFRNGKWDLPKGKLDEGESIEACALREVKEETGVENVSIIIPLITTYHVYQLDDKNILKPGYWYAMKSDNTDNMQPQTEEGIAELRWVAIGELSAYYTNMFPAIIDVLEDYKNTIQLI